MLLLVLIKNYFVISDRFVSFQAVGNALCTYEKYICPIMFIAKTRLFKYIESFTTKQGKFSDKKF